MSKPSWRKLIDEKIIKRTDNGMAIQFDSLRIRPGFNLRDVAAEDYEEDIEALVAHIQRGGQVPALEVSLSGDGAGADVVDGHRRHEAYRRARERGMPIEYVRMEPFIGNDVDRMLRVMTSNEGRKLRPLEVAEGYKRLAAINMPPEDIARRVGKTRQHVDQMLLLASAPHEVHKMVANGDVSATVAVDIVRKHGDKSADVLGQAKANAGKAKVTAAAVKPWAPAAKFVAPLVDTVSTLADQIAGETLEQLLDLERQGKLETDSVTVELPAGLLMQLINQNFAIGCARESAQMKVREKQNKAAQMEIEAA